MTTKAGTAALFALLLALCGCNDAKLSTYENYALGQVRMQTWKTEEARNHPVSALLRADPEKLAAENAAKGDFRLYGVSSDRPPVNVVQGAGKPAPPPPPEKPRQPQLVGVTCTPSPKDTVPLPIIIGCVPPPAIVLKHIIRYNVAMVSHPSFPAARDCKPDKQAIDGIDEYMKQEEQSWRDDRADRRAERRRELKAVNE